MKKEKIKIGAQIEKASDKLGVLIPGLAGAVSTTFIAGVEAVRQQKALPIGSLTQMGTVRLGKRDEYKIPKIKEFVDLADLDAFVFGGWDIFEDNCFEGAIKCQVLDRALLEDLRPLLESIHPYPGIYDARFIRNLDGRYVKGAKDHWESVLALEEDIREFKQKEAVERCVMIWCASTEAFIKPEAVHQDIESFEKGLKDNHPAISPSMIYAYTAIKNRIPFINGSPNLTVDIPALTDLASSLEVPIAGKDFKTGQTLMKTILAPGLKARLLGLTGWFSTNILGNRDGLVLDDKDAFRTKEESKLSVLDYILQPDVYPELYSRYYHKVVINYYPPRGDNKEGWDCIDIFGWLGYPMHIRVDFQCRDSILAAPLVLDLVLFADLAQRAAMSGIQEWLSFYFKSPMVKESLYPEHDLFIQMMKLKNTLRYLMGEEQITHLGIDYYFD